jgi:hypothetical protein
VTYTPKGAAIPELALDAADRANLSLLQAAEAERPSNAAAMQWDLMLLLLQLESDAVRKPSAEQASLVGTWTEYVSAPREDMMLVRPHYDFFQLPPCDRWYRHRAAGDHFAHRPA